MERYIDGFVFPISSDRISQYKIVAEKIAEIYREHGAIDYQEFLGDDLYREGTRAFPTMLSANEGDAIVFGWITYDSRETRDLVNQKLEADPRIPGLVATIVEPDNRVFDPGRMAFGGFKSLLEATKNRGA